MDDAVKPTFQFESGQSAGQMLRKLREHAGVELEVLAASLKVPPQKIRALEADDLSALPAIFFARGLAGNICRHFGVDPHPVLAMMPDDKPHIATDDESINTPFSQNRFSSSLRSTGLSSWVLAGAGILVLAALLLFLYPTLNAKLGKRSAASAAVAAASAPASEPAPALGQLQAAPTLGTLAPAPAAPAASAATAMPATLQPAAPASAAVVTPAAAATPAASAAVASSDGMQFTATGETWVQVRNSAGRTIYERTLRAGQTEQVAVPAYPVRVTIGRAENVQLSNRGQAFDLAAVARTGVARFTIQ